MYVYILLGGIFLWLFSSVTALALYRGDNYVCDNQDAFCYETFSFSLNFYSDIGRLEPYRLNEEHTTYHQCARAAFILSGISIALTMGVAAFILQTYQRDARVGFVIVLLAAMFMVGVTLTVAAASDADRIVHVLGASCGTLGLALLAWLLAWQRRETDWVWLVLHSIGFMVTLLYLGVLVGVEVSDLDNVRRTQIGALTQRFASILALLQLGYIMGVAAYIAWPSHHKQSSTPSAEG